MTAGQKLLLGQVVGVHGLQGWLKLRSHTDPIDAILNYQPWQLRHRGGEQQIARVRSKMQTKGLVIQLPGIDTREAAEALVGAEIWVDRSLLPPAAPGEYYWVDLEGLAVATVDGRDLGRVHHVMATGANDVLVVHGDRERLIPFVQPDVVTAVDLDAGRITVDWDPEF
jgi:16S rRNA processing protein RimM